MDVVLFPVALFSTPWRSGWKLHRAMEEKEGRPYVYRHEGSILLVRLSRLFSDDRQPAWVGSRDETSPVE